MQAQAHCTPAETRVTMVIYDIPYAPCRDGGWHVDISNAGHRRFNKRRDALRFAIDCALSAQRRGEETLISIEGIDGVWRMFDRHVKGVA
jgi:hypothetical protein